MIVDRGVPVAMRDGVILRADVFRPDHPEPRPALLLRTPYDRSVPLIPPSGIELEAAIDAGYALVAQDVRGLHESEGTFYPFVTEAEDGYDSVEWVAAQPWCDGAVGMVGRSYAATCQWLAASERPPHLRAICPVVTGSDFLRGWVYQGGAFQLGFNLFWVWMMSAEKGSTKPEPLFRHRPLRTVPLPDPAWARFYFDWLDHPRDDEYWRAMSINRRYDRIQVPALNVGGWYDVFLGGTLENFVRMRGEGGSEAARAGQRLVVGPWAHGSTYGPFPDHGFDAFPGGDSLGFLTLQLRFFERHLRGAPSRDEPPVRLFVLGANRWRDEDDWPPARARSKRWYLRARGLLSPEPPGDEEADGYTFDPRDPAPTIGGPTSLPPRMMKANSGPLDQRRLDGRSDVLTYTSEPLPRPLEVTGPLVAVLYAATDGPDTDFVVKLVDVHPDGRALILAEGVIRCSFRDGYARPGPVEPSAVYPYEIDLVATAALFGAGHRIRIMVTSSSFPRFDPNPNTGKPFGTDEPGDLRPARQMVFHDGVRPSHVLLPIVPS